MSVGERKNVATKTNMKKIITTESLRLASAKKGPYSARSEE